MYAHLEIHTHDTCNALNESILQTIQPEIHSTNQFYKLFKTDEIYLNSEGYTIVIEIKGYSP